MIDIKLIRENPEIVRDNLNKRFREDKIPLIEKIQKKIKIGEN